MAFKLRKCLYIVWFLCAFVLLSTPLSASSFLSSMMMFLKSIYLACEVALSFSCFKSFNVRVKTIFQNRRVSGKIIGCLLASAPCKVPAHVCRWALNLACQQIFLMKPHENNSNHAKIAILCVFAKLTIRDW